ITCSLRDLVFIFRPRTSRIRIFECPHRLSDKLLKSRCDAACSSPSRGGVYYAFLFQSQP
ncbi:hypothetical protein D4Y73_19360, partial [Salmonella enterica subsp. enterica serovar Fresno]|nr:hypothetical protein [Salmonella enterica subsp. enterica serovar Fresno]